MQSDNLVVKLEKEINETNPLELTWTASPCANKSLIGTELQNAFELTLLFPRHFDQSFVMKFNSNRHESL